MKTSPESFTIFVSSDFYDLFAEQFAAMGPSHCVWKRLDYPVRQDNFKEILPEADALITRQDINDEEYAVAKKLKLIQLPTAGYDHIDIERAARHGIPVSTNGGANAISVAEHTMMLILCLYRYLLFHHNAVVNGPWVNRKHECLELYGKKIGIVGLGNVGKQLAIRAKAFGMSVLFYDIRRENRHFEEQHNLHFVSMDELLDQSDVVSFHVPLTAKTHGLINAKTIDKMRDGALLINTSRGKVQNEVDLCEALSSGKLRGAGLDVFNQEPVPSSSPLLTFDNVVLTPHSGPSYETLGRVVENMAHNINRVSHGLPPEFLAVNYNNVE